MTWKTLLCCACGIVWIVALAATAMAGGPDVVGSLVGSRNATLDGERPLPNTVLLGGDKLQVNDGLAMVTLERGNRVALGGQSEASFLREAGVVTVLMNRGSLSLYHPQAGSSFTVKVGDVTIAPAGGPGTLGEVALAGGTLVVTAKDGSLNVEEDGATRKVAKGYTMTIAPAARGASASASPGNPRVNYVRNNRASLGFGSSGGAAGAAAFAFVLQDHHHPHVSPIHPGR
jgi:hypothetical protein